LDNYLLDTFFYGFSVREFFSVSLKKKQMETTDKKLVKDEIVDIRIDQLCNLETLVEWLSEILNDNKNLFDTIEVLPVSCGRISIIGERLETDEEYTERIEKSNRIKAAVLKCKTEQELIEYQTFVELKNKFDKDNLTQMEHTVLEALKNERFSGKFDIN
jgi:hypothetical protein